jgi:DNA-binding HxlR family transcriptional regulator
MASHADDCEAVLRVLLDEGPLSPDDLRQKCAPRITGAALSNILSDLISHGQVVTFSFRRKGRKVQQYAIRELNR